MKRKLLSIILIYIMILNSSGCWDFEDINNRGVITAVGLDYINDKYVHTLGLISFRQEDEQGNIKLEKPDAFKVTISGDTFEEAEKQLKTKYGKETFRGVIRAMVFGEEYARTQGILSYMNKLNTLTDARKTRLVVISNGPASNIVNYQAKKNIGVGFLIENIIEHLDESDKTIATDVGDILSTISFSKIGYIIPYIGIENDNLQCLGLAVLKDNKLIDTIEFEKTFGLLRVVNERPQIFEDIKVKGVQYTLNTITKDKKIKTHYINNKVKIDINLEIVAMVEYKSSVKTLNNNQVRELEKILDEKIKDQIVSIIKKSQNEYKSDIFRFAYHFKSQNSKIYREIDWEKEYPNALINVNVSTRIINKD